MTISRSQLNENGAYKKIDMRTPENKVYTSPTHKSELRISRAQLLDAIAFYRVSRAILRNSRSRRLREANAMHAPIVNGRYQAARVV